MWQFSNIRSRLQISFCAIILFAVLCSGLSYFFLRKLSAYHQADQQIVQLNLLLQEARKSEKDFMLFDRKEIEFLETGTISSTRKHKQLTDSIDNLLQDLLRHELIQSKGAEAQLQGIRFSMTTYQNTFTEFVNKMYQRGFRNHGLEVQMRNYAHELQKAPAAEEREYVLMMRRHEKDFIMRSDLKYVEKMHGTARSFAELIEEGHLPHMDAVYKARNLQLLDDYLEEFDKLVELEKELGLADNDGLRGKLKKSAEEVEPQVAAVKSLIHVSVKELQMKALITVIGFIILLLVLGMAAALLLARGIARPVILLDGVIQEVLKGNFNVQEKLKQVKREDEIGRLAQNFKVMLHQQQEHLQQISENNAQLKAAAEEDARRQWIVEGLNKFTDLMKAKSNLKESSQTILSELVKYTQSNQGGLFIVQEGEEAYMELTACFAYDRRKYVEKKFHAGDGLVGMAWLEKDTIYMTDVPQDYIKITSGLGDARPNSILIVPLVSEQKVQGVVELASFNLFEDYQIRFVEELAKRLAGIIEGIRLQEQTQKLLMETRTMAEELQAQEEEMRQNMEELQATQEEMYRSELELQQMLQSSKQKESALQQEVLSLKKKLQNTQSLAYQE